MNSHPSSLRKLPFNYQSVRTRGINTLDRFSGIFHKGDHLYAFLYTMQALSETGFTLKGTKGNRFFPSRAETLSEELTELPPLKMYPLPLTGTHF